MLEEKIMELLEKYHSLSYQSLLNFLHCSDMELASTIKQMENIKIYKRKKDYEILDGKPLGSGTIIYKDNKYMLKDNNNAHKYHIDDYNLKTNFYIGDIFIYEQAYGNNVILRQFVKHTEENIVAVLKNVKNKEFKVFHSLIDDRPFVVYDASLNEKGRLYRIKPAYKKVKGQDIAEVICPLDHFISDNDSDVLSLIYEAKVPFEFDDDYLVEVNKVNDHVLDNELVGRKDFTNKVVFTIDGDDSKDFDDAVSLEHLDNGNLLLGVHIADVSYYVKEHSLIDKEALKRGTSIYLADRTIPMLHERLSNGICSLNPNVIRLTLSCMMEYDKNGKKVNYEIVSSYIKSKYRMTYNNVNKIVVKHDEDVINKYKDIAPILEDMLDLSLKIRARRTAKGAIDFDIPELGVKLNDKNEAIDIYKRERDKAEMLIEDFMLEANESVAEFLHNLDYPCMYRVHEEPSTDKLKELEPVLKSFNLKLRKTGSGVKPKDVQELLEKAKDLQSGRILSEMLLRSMAKARYDKAPLGHFGLSLENYCHFTSPIRRYPDLFVHRVINNLIIRQNNFKQDLLHYENICGEVAFKASYRERVAIDLEREVLNLKICEYMEKYIGNTYIGYVSSVMPYGTFIEILDGVEGLAHVAEMDSYMIYDDETKSLSAEYSNLRLQMGDKVKVIVSNVDKKSRKIDFRIIKKLK